MKARFRRDFGAGSTTASADGNTTEELPVSHRLSRPSVRSLGRDGLGSRRQVAASAVVVLVIGTALAAGLVLPGSSRVDPSASVGSSSQAGASLAVVAETSGATPTQTETPSGESAGTATLSESPAPSGSADVPGSATGGGWGKDLVITYPDNLKSNSVRTVTVSGLGSASECEGDIAFSGSPDIEHLGTLGEPAKNGVWAADFSIPASFSGPSITMTISCWRDGYRRGPQRSWPPRQLAVGAGGPWNLTVSFPAEVTGIMNVTTLEFPITVNDPTGGYGMKCDLTLAFPGQAPQVIPRDSPYYFEMNQAAVWSEQLRYRLSPPYSFGVTRWTLTCTDALKITVSRSGTFNFVPIDYLASPSPTAPPTAAPTPSPDMPTPAPPTPNPTPTPTPAPTPTAAPTSAG